MNIYHIDFWVFSLVILFFPNEFSNLTPSQEMAFLLCFHSDPTHAPKVLLHRLILQGLKGLLTTSISVTYIASFH